MLKVLCTAYVAILIPVYWRHSGPGNFLWFSDLALFLAVAALWLESRLLASMQAVSVVLLELGWIGDFLFVLVAGGEGIGMSRYMFKPEVPLLVRALSTFHFWLPLLLLWLVWRLGYDRRAWLAQTLLAWLVLPACYFFTDPSRNINWVFGPGEDAWTGLPPWLHLALLMALFPACVYLPTHLALRWIFTRRETRD